MKVKFFKRILSVLMCILLFCNSFTLTSFAAPPVSLEAFFVALYGFMSAVIAMDESNALDKTVNALTPDGFKARAQVLSQFSAFKDVLPSGLSEADFLELLTWFCTADNYSLINEKYGHDLAVYYNSHCTDFQDFMLDIINPIFNGLEDFVHTLYSSDISDYELDSDNNIKVPAPVLKDHITTNNNLYYPKNAIGKMSYRTDERWHNMYDGSTTGGGWWYDQLDLYTGNFGFSALGGDDIYMIFFARTNNTYWYGKYQYHLYVTTNDVWYDDRDEIEYTDYTLNYEYWDNIDGSQEQSVKGVLYSGRNHYFDLSLASYFQIGAFSDIQAYTTGFRFNHLNSGSFSLSDYKTVYSTDLQQFIAIPYTHFADSLDFHSTKCSNDGCDVGYYASLSPISTVYNIDTTKIPDNYYVTVSGDTIYDYSITNPDTGDTTTITNFITNNYNFPPKEDSDNSGGTSGKIEVGGKVEVEGKVDVNVGVDVFVPPVDINVNVNGGGNGGNGSSYEMPDDAFVTDWLNAALDESSGIRSFINDFFSCLPAPITVLMGIGLTLSIILRIVKR